MKRHYIEVMYEEEIDEEAYEYYGGGSKALETYSIHMPLTGTTLKVNQRCDDHAALWAHGSGSVVWEVA